MFCVGEVELTLSFAFWLLRRCYEADEVIRQETRLWDEKKKATQIMRVKEGEKCCETLVGSCVFSWFFSDVERRGTCMRIKRVDV